MKKDEFFAQLRTAFAGMDEELLTDILGDYENHFKEGIENGKSEEEICEELGNVEEIRQAFLDENPAAMTINVNSNSDAVGNSDIYNRFYPGIQRVNAQLTDADIEIKKSNTNEVELSVTGGLADDMEALKETLRVSASVGTLSIQQEKKAGISVSYAASRLFGLKVGKYSAGIAIHIAVPEQFEKIKVSMLMYTENEARLAVNMRKQSAFSAPIGSKNPFASWNERKDDNERINLYQSGNE